MKIGGINGDLIKIRMVALRECEEERENKNFKIKFLRNEGAKSPSNS